MSADNTITTAINTLCEVAKNMVNPDKIIEIVEVPYEPDKCSAKSAAAMLGIAIPSLSKTIGHPLLDMGGVTSIWCGTHYEPISDAQRKQVIRAFANGAKLLKPSILTSDFNREFERSFSASAVPSNVFGYGGPLLGINFEDGVLCVNGEKEDFRRGHRPEDLTTYCIPAKWKEARTHDKWESFMVEAIPDEESRQYVLAMFANAIAGDPFNVQKIMLLIGAAGAGKSTMIEAIAGCIGYQNVMRTDNLAQITKDDSRHRMKLAHATLCVSADASEKIGDKDALKMIVSKEPIIARKLYAEPIEIKPRASLVVASNEMGLSYVLSDPGIARRFDIINFKKAKSWAKRDINLHHKLATEEARGGIGISLGLALLSEAKKNQGKIDRPKALEQELERLRIEGDPFMSWMVASGLSVDEQDHNTSVLHQDDLHSSFNSYCAQHGYNIWSIRRFKARLRALNLPEEGRQGGKHCYAFYVKDLNLLRVGRLLKM